MCVMFKNLQALKLPQTLMGCRALLLFKHYSTSTGAFVTCFIPYIFEIFKYNQVAPDTFMRHK